MKNIKKFLFVLTVSSLFFSACGMGGSQQESAGSSSGVDDSVYRATEAANYVSNNSRKFITTASLTLRINDLKNGEVELNEIMNKYNAYTTETSVYVNTLRYTIRIHANDYKEFFDEIKIIGKIEHYNENREDVTLHYYDLEGKLTTQRELIQTYREYLGKAENIEEIMAVEKQIAELQNEIDKTGEEFTKLNNSIDFSTIRLTLKGPRSDDVYYTETIGDRIQILFKGFGGYVSTMATILIGLIIYGIPTLIILLLLYFVLLGKVGILRKIWRLLNEKKGNK
jgi:hypothetical protein